MSFAQPYRAAAPAAVLLALPAAVFAATCFIAIDRHSHSVSDTLYGISRSGARPSSCGTGSCAG
jgi:hypothetical protein